MRSALQSWSTNARDKQPLSLYHLLDPENLADPYPLYSRLRSADPVHWGPFLHAWVVTRYADVVRVLTHCSAYRTPTPDQLAVMGLSQLGPIAQVMVQQMLFMDAPAHTRLRALCSQAFTPSRVEALRTQIREIADSLLAKVQSSGRMDVIADFAAPLSAIVTAEMLGLPTSDHEQLKAWSADFAEMLGTFQHNPDRGMRVRRSLEDMVAYFREAIRLQKQNSRKGLIYYLLTRLDLGRKNNQHVAFGWSAHCCFGAPLARLEGQVAFATLLGRLPTINLLSIA